MVKHGVLAILVVALGCLPLFQLVHPAASRPAASDAIHATETAFAGRVPENATVSPDGQYIIGVDQPLIGVWRANTREFLGVLKGAQSPPGDSAVAFSPDGRLVWNTGLYFYLWDLDTRDTILMQPYNIGYLHSRHFVSETARYIAFWQCDSTGSSHGLCRSVALAVFDTATRHMILTTGDDFTLHVATAVFDEDAHTFTVSGCARYQVLSDMAYGACEAESMITWDLGTGAQID